MEEIELTSQALFGKKYIISLNKFIFLNIITMGLYSIWWTYKGWRLFQEREAYNDLMPVWRTLFGIFFFYSLFERIKRFALRWGYEKDYSSGYLLLGIVFFGLLSYLPYPCDLLILFDIVCFIPPFLALNYAIENSGDYEVVVEDSFNTKQIVLIIVGSALWLCEIYVAICYYSGRNYY